MKDSPFLCLVKDISLGRVEDVNSPFEQLHCNITLAGLSFPCTFPFRQVNFLTVQELRFLKPS